MTEVPQKNTHFFGQADARKLDTAEDVASKEFALTPEQRQVVEVMQLSSEKFTRKMVRESEKARAKLEQLHGKELVAAGMKKVGLGLGLGWVTETAGKWAANKASQQAGPWVGEQGDRLVDWLGSRPDQGRGEVSPTVTLTAAIQNSLLEMGHENFAQAGPDIWRNDIGPYLANAAGVEFAGPVYRLLTRKANLPKLRWYEWIVGQAGAFLPWKTTMHIKRFELNLVNPVTVSGLFNVAQGLYDMAMVQRTRSI